MATARLRAGIHAGRHFKCGGGDVPTDDGHEHADGHSLFLEVMGSPITNAPANSTECGGGMSSRGRKLHHRPAKPAGRDVDYTFAQTAVRDTFGRITAPMRQQSSAVGPFDVAERAVPAPSSGEPRVPHSKHQYLEVSSFTRFPVEQGLLSGNPGHRN